EARQSLVPVFKRDPSLQALTLKMLKLKLDTVGLLEGEKKPDGSLRSEQKSQEAKLAYLVNARDYQSWRHEVELAAERYINLADLYKTGDRETWRQTVYEFLPDHQTSEIRNASAELISSSLEPNMSVDPQATQRKLAEIMAAVKPVTKEIDVGTLIIS